MGTGTTGQPVTQPWRGAASENAFSSPPRCPPESVSRSGPDLSPKVALTNSRRWPASTRH